LQQSSCSLVLLKMKGASTGLYGRILMFDPLFVAPGGQRHLSSRSPKGSRRLDGA
jgi:hypothetical protein